MYVETGGGIAILTFRRPFLAVLAVIPLVAGCATIGPGDRQRLVRLFADLRQAPRKEPVIIIPGALGSILEDTETGRVAWGRMGGRTLPPLALPIDHETLGDNRDSIVAVNILRRMAVIPGLIEFKANEDLIRALQEAGGYDKGDLEHPRPGDNCFLFWYDWRRDLVEAAGQLGAMIERLAREMGDPNLKVHLIAQSAGGLVARYYVKYGTAAVFVCESHLQLTQNLTALDNLLHALFVQEATAQHRAICLYCQRHFGALNAKPASAYREGTGTSSQPSYREGS